MITAIEDLRAQLGQAPRITIPGIIGRIWAAHAAGEIDEAEAASLDSAARERQAQPPAAAPARRPTGSRPRTPESMVRRRGWVAGGWVPPHIASHYTLAAQAVLSVIAGEITKTGTCTRPVDAIAALAGVCRSTAKAAIRRARELGHLAVTLRPRLGQRHDTSVVTLTDGGWTRWITRRQSRGGGVKSLTPTYTQSLPMDAPRQLGKRGKGIRESLSRVQRRESSRSASG